MMKSNKQMRQLDRRIRWTPDLLWKAVETNFSNKQYDGFGCGPERVGRKAREWTRCNTLGNDELVLDSSEIRHCIEVLFTKASREILVAVAFIEDVDDLMALLRQAAMRGVEVKVMCHPDSALYASAQLLNSQVELFTLRNCHLKFIVADCSVLKTSANLTRYSLGRNVEYGEYDPRYARVLALRRFFFQHWRQLRR